jgi:hypothetical protein
VYNDNTFGFLRLTVSPTSVAGVFVTVDTASGKSGVGDSFTVDFQTNTVATGVKKPAPSPKPKPAPVKGGPKVVAKPPKAKSKSAAAKGKRR